MTNFSIFLFQAIVSFGKISETQKREAEELGVICFSWEEFVLLVYKAATINQLFCGCLLSWGTQIVFSSIFKGSDST